MAEVRGRAFSPSNTVWRKLHLHRYSSKNEQTAGSCRSHLAVSSRDRKEPARRAMPLNAP